MRFAREMISWSNGYLLAIEDVILDLEYVKTLDELRDILRDTRQTAVNTRNGLIMAEANHQKAVEAGEAPDDPFM